MPPKLPKCAICQTAAAGKYRCPIDDVDYCSVKCFKTHKQEGCNGSTKAAASEDTVKDGAKDEVEVEVTSTATNGTAPRSEPDQAESAAQDPTPQPHVKQTLKLETDDRPRKKLKELHWPPEPDASIFLDPLAREDVKPLRRRECEAIATSPTIRRLLLTQPSLIPTLSRLLAIPADPLNSSYNNHSSHSLRAPPPPGPRETSLRLLLDLPITSAPTYYRPSGRAAGGEYRTGSHVSQQVRKRNGPEGKDLPRGGVGLVHSTPVERKEVQVFVDEVEKVLSELRKDARF